MPEKRPDGRVISDNSTLSVLFPGIPCRTAYIERPENAPSPRQRRPSQKLPGVTQISCATPYALVNEGPQCLKAGS
ncbi:hypothetical protein AA102526_1630 [Asaia lannensis NBRC 102526]|nr:hypothetical protein AA102526_1630 [Asaia lannensis NBRC 102526]